MILWVLMSVWFVIFTIGAVRAWQRRYEWWFKCRNEELWRQHFKDNVSSGWIHYDGVGH